MQTVKLGNTYYKIDKKNNLSSRCHRVYTLYSKNT